MITTYNQIREIANLANAKDNIFAPWVATVRLRMIQLFGSAVYVACEDYAALTPPRSAVPALAANWESLATCEALLILHSALPHLNTVFSQTGGISVDGRIGEGGYRYLTPNEMKARRAEIMAQIDAIITIVSGYTSGAFAEIVGAADD